MRINKYIASAGITSRRKADELVKNGRVRINGSVMTEPGYQVSEGDEVVVNGEPIYPEEKKLYYMLNKPLGCITSLDDEVGRLTVCDLMADVDSRLFPVGRLDYNTSGLLFMTNDGDFAYRITHPKNKVGKTYRVRIPGQIDKVQLSRLRHGVDIGGFTTSRARVDIISWSKKSTILEITIYEGKNRQVRKMFEAVGFQVQELERISVGKIGLGRLKHGQYRKLNPSEVKYLMGE